MKERTRRIFIMIVMAALIVSLMAASFAALTYGRYSGGRFDENSPYEDYIDFVGATAYEVSSPEELVNAINNGYSYIKIAADAEEPFVVNNDIANVYTNLVIDVNGKTVIRNSRNPVLDVQRNVSAVLVYDSTVENDPNAQPGSFYNPVGSALQVSGGTLTVAAGRYDSGPKDGIATSLPSDTSDIISVTVHSRTSRTTQDGYSVSASASMPALTEDVYLSETWEAENSTYNSTYIEGDTYLIYSKEQNCYVDNGTLIVNAVKDENGSFVGDALAVPCNAASCDFYYYYPIDEDGNPIKTDGTASAPQTYAVIYGYNDVKALAANDALDGTDLSKNGLVWPYAAVRSTLSSTSQEETQAERTTGGEGFMRGGAFSTYFGTENTYGIYAEGGTLSVADGVSFTAVGEGVCIHSEPGGDENQDTSADAASLEISGGTFSSQLGDTIQMEGGSVTITGGAFVKDASSAPNNRDNNGSAIDIQGGTLKVNADDTTVNRDVTFTVTGDHVNGIKMDKGTETGTETQTADVIKNATFNFNEKSGGTSVAAIQVAGGTLEVSGSNFNFNREASSNTAFSHNNGIYVRSSGEGDAAQSGTVTATNCTFNFGNNTNSSVTASAGIASVGGEVTAKNCTFTLPGYSNYGIYATGGETTVTGGSITMTGRDTTQIGSGENAARGNDNFGINISGGEVTVSGCEISVSGTYSSGILAQGGEVNLSGTDADKTTITITGSHQNNLLTSSAVSSETVTNGGTTTAGTINIEGVVTINSDSLGITARGKDGEQGKISVAGSGNITLRQGLNGDQTIVPMCTTGIYVSNGIVENEGAISLYSTIDPTCSWVPFPEETTLTSNINNGVYVQGGSLTSNGTLNVDFTGVVSDPTTDENGDNYNLGGAAYREFQVKSYAVRVEASDTTSSTVTIRKGEITNSCGGGVLVNGGTVYLGAEDGTGPVVDTTGTGRYSLIGVTGAAGNWAYTPPSSGGDAVKVDVGTLYVYGGSYTADYGNGILVTNGTANVSGGKFTGTDDRKDGENLYTGAGSNYGLKVLGGSAKITGGEFTAQQYGGGVFIMGTETNNQQTQITAANIHVTGATAVSVWNYADVVFGTENGDNSLLTASAESTGLAVEVTTAEYGIAARQKIVINSGTFTGQTMTGNKHGIWYGNRATMTINGGIFTGGGGSGLFFQVNQWEEINNVGYNRVKVTGGTFIGNGGSIGAVSNGEHNNSDLGYQIRLHDFVDCTTGKSIYYYSYRNATSTNNVVALSAYAWNTGTIGHDAQRIQDNTMDYPKIEIK